MNVEHIALIGLGSIGRRHLQIINKLRPDNCSGAAAYFSHSFMAVPADSAHRIADCSYGGHKVAVTIGRYQITGCQFHPEKSGEVGLKVLRGFYVD